MRRIVVPALVFAGLLPFAASAWTSGQEIPGGALVDVTPEGFDALVALLPSLIPSEIAVPDVNVGPYQGNFFVGDGRGGLSITNIKVDVNLIDAQINPQTDYLAFDALAEIGVNSPSDQMNINAYVDVRFCLPWVGCTGWSNIIDADCPVYVEPADITLGADIALDVKDDLLVPYLDATLLDENQDGRAIDWALDDVNLRGDCLVGDILSVADDLGIDVEGLLLDAFEPQLNDQIQDIGVTIEDTIEEAFASATVEQNVSLGESEMAISIHPDDVVIRPEGVRLSMTGSFGSTTHPCVVEYGHFESPESAGGDPEIGVAPADVPSPFHLGAMLDDDLVNQALFAAYNGGALCYTVGADSGLPVNTALLGVLSPTLADLFPESQPLTIKTRPAEVPVATPIGDHDLNITVADLGVDFVGQLDYRNATILAADLDVDAGIDVALDDVAGQLSIQVPLTGDDLNPTIRLNEFAPGEDDAIADSFGGLFDSVVAPLLGDLLGGLSFPLPTIAAGSSNLGLQSFTMAAAGPDQDLFGAYANIGTVAYQGGGCDGSGGGCSTGCGSTGTIVPIRAVLFPLAFAVLLVRRRR